MSASEFSAGTARERGTEPGGRVVVTGAASGIGKAVADTLHADGCDVVGLDRVESHGDYPVLATDLSDPDRIRETLASLTGTFTGLCNAAGVPATAPWDVVLAVNFLGLRELSLGLTEKFEPGSNVVNIASQAGYQIAQDTGLADRVLAESEWGAVHDRLATDERFRADPYGFTKHFVHRATRRWAAENIARGTRFTSVSPGPVNTPIAGDFREHMGAERYDAAVRGAGRLGEPADIADVVTFLLSDRARWVNGIDLAVDGGLSAVRASAPAPSTNED